MGNFSGLYIDIPFASVVSCKDRNANAGTNMQRHDCITHCEFPLGTLRENFNANE